MTNNEKKHKLMNILMNIDYALIGASTGLGLSFFHEGNIVKSIAMLLILIATILRLVYCSRMHSCMKVDINED